MHAAADFRATLATLERMKELKVVSDYAIGGAMAIVFWTEPVATFDLDVFIRLPAASGVIISLDPIYRWAEENHFSVRGEHVIIFGVPVQFIPSHNPLADEAIERAAVRDYEGGVSVRVIRPEYLIGLYLEPSARTAKRLERVSMLREEAEIDRKLLTSIVERYNLKLP